MKLTIEQRLLNHTIEDLETGCWNCDYKSTGNGYPLISIEGKSFLIHRIAYELWVGTIPKGLYICHTCDNSMCINPDHLWPGTQKENMNDMYRKGRGPTGDKNGARTHPESRSRGEQHSKIMLKVAARGEGSGNVKLTKQEVSEILSYKQQGCRPVDVAKFMKRSPSIIDHVWYGRTWKYISREEV